MSCNPIQPTRRLPKLQLLSQNATSELINTLQPEEGDPDIEFIIVVRKDADLDYIIPYDDNLNTGDKLVQLDFCEEKCFLYQVDLSSCQNSNFIEYELTKLEVPCDSQEVKDLTTNRVIKATNPISVSIFENSGCGCSGGSCVYR